MTNTLTSKPQLAYLKDGVTPAPFASAGCCGSQEVNAGTGFRVHTAAEGDGHSLLTAGLLWQLPASMSPPGPLLSAARTPWSAGALCCCRQGIPGSVGVPGRGGLTALNGSFSPQAAGPSTKGLSPAWCLGAWPARPRPASEPGVRRCHCPAGVASGGLTWVIRADQLCAPCGVCLSSGAGVDRPGAEAQSLLGRGSREGLRSF